MLVDEKAWAFNVTKLEPFTQLTTLDLSGNYFSGFVEEDGLKNLLVLNLADNVFRTPPSCLRNMSFLQHLDLSYNQMSGRFQDVIPSNPTSLRYLDLSNNTLRGELQPNIFPNFTSLESLDLSGNNFEGKLFFSSLANHSNLNFLDLARNNLQVQTEDSSWRPSFQLRHLSLPGCNLNQPNGIVPKFLSKQHNLRYIDLSNNNLFGPFPFSISNNSICGDFGLENNCDALSLYSKPLLISLTISGNNFHGELPKNIGFIFPHVMFLNLSRCHFEGPIPASIAHMSQLQVLDLSSNNFSRKLPRQFFTDLTSLFILKLNDNHLEGEIIPDYMNLTQLMILKLGNNNFGGTIKNALTKSDMLLCLDISNNKVTGSLPRWISNLFSLETLSVSKNNMEGQIPTGIWKLPSLTYLDLSENNFNGSIPSSSEFYKLSAMLLRHNKLTGSIPSSLSSVTNLRALDLRDNQLSGGIPLWINKFQKLEILLLAGNNFGGQIPHELCELRNINILDLSQNQLSGRIPTCLGNMSFGSQPTNSFTDTRGLHYRGNLGFPYSDMLDFDFTLGVDEIDELLVKNLYLPYVGFGLLHMSILHLSSNNFSGIIPPELGNLLHVLSINLSHNFLSGSIPSHFSNLKEMEGLDLSHNNLSGVIPYKLVELHYLATFNVSYNNLTGITPEAGQFGHFDEKSYLGNPGLCVSLLTKSCKRVSNNDMLPLTSTAIEQDGGEDHDMEDFLWTFGVTAFIAFMATITVLFINRQWREAFFDFVEWHLLWWLL